MPRNNFDDRDDSADFQMNDSAESRPLTFGELGVPGPLVRVLAADDKKTHSPFRPTPCPIHWPAATFSAEGAPAPAKPSHSPFRWSPARFLRFVRRNRDGGVPQGNQAPQEGQPGRAPRRRLPTAPARPGAGPTRELANQINDVLMPLAHTFGMNTTTVYGGVKYIHQIRDLKAGADIVVACRAALRTAAPAGAHALVRRSRGHR